MNILPRLILVCVLLCGSFAMAKDPEKSKKSAGSGVRVEAFSFGKVLAIGPDGKIETREIGGDIPNEVLDQLPKEIQDLLKKGQEQIKAGAIVNGGVDVFVEKNGKRERLKTELNDKDALKIFEELGKSGGDLSPEALKSMVEGLMRQAGGNLPPEAKDAFDSATKMLKKTAPVENRSDDISSKLDKILERLDRIENEVKALKAKN